MSDRSTRSSWYMIHEKKEFLKIIKPGDLLEFKRNGYHHWAVYAGRPSNFRRYLAHLNFDANVDYVVHRANPGDSDFFNLSGRCTSVAKGLHGIGNVVVEPLDDVWSDSQVRVNNSGDISFGADDIETIFDRAFAGGDQTYNVIFNNCEHFATYCRYGQKFSGQVVKAAGLTVAVGVGVGLLAYGLSKLFVPEEEKDDRRRVRQY